MRTIPFLLPLAVAVLPFVAAAPVPKREPVPVTSYCAEALAKLPFVGADEIPEEWKGRGEGPKSGIVALAVTLPKTTYAVGEPIEPLFALKNRTDRRLGLDIRLDLFDDPPRFVNSCSIDIVETTRKKVVGPQRELVEVLRGKGERSGIPANGYYAAAGSIGSELPPGEYELSWRYGWAKSNAVKFTVADRQHKGPTPFRSVRLIHVTEFGDEKEQKAVDREGTAREWDAAGARTADVSEAAFALGSGHLGRYYPSLRSLPETVGKLRASVQWSAKDGEETFVVTLGVTDRKAVASVPSDLHVYLLVECDAKESDAQLRAQADELQRRVEDLRIDSDSPFELTVKLPKDWTDEAGATGPARVAVLLATKELSREWAEEKKELRKLEADGEADWVVRTPWRELSLPKPSEKEKKRDR